MRLSSQTCLALALLLGASSAQDEEDICSLPKQRGNCYASKLRIFYNSATSRCESFSYGGCGGNANNFQNLEECQSACQPTARSLNVNVKSEHCILPPVEGNQCRGMFPKVTFDANRGECVRYLYGGCNGTPNLYDSMEECASACIFEENERRPQPRMRATAFRSLPAQQNQQEEEDSKIVFPGYGQEDICQLPPISPGNIACMGFSEKWTFDSKQGKCVKYVYGGCRGTENLFVTEAACQQRCQPQTPSATLRDSMPDRCLLPPVRPSPFACMAYAEKFTFNAQSGACERYVYGGCGGTDNLYNTLNECLQTCKPSELVKPKTIEVCGLPIVTGNCRGRKPVYGFNQDTQRCELFYYGGCKGNDNQFSSLKDCVDTCGGTEPMESPVCSSAQCDVSERLYYAAKGCRPIVSPGECCPSSWDCSVWEDRLKKTDKCFLANAQHPQGIFYDIDDDMPEMNQGCRASCRCRGPAPGYGNQFPAPMCAVFDCFNPWADATGLDCKLTYDNKDQCCSPAALCDNELKRRSTCDFEGKTYYKGERMYSEENKCLVCQCDESWTGRPSKESCHEIDCYSRNPFKLLQGCQPVHEKGSCCPVDWVCPEDKPAVEDERSAVPPAMPQCPEGSRPVLTNQDLLPIQPINPANNISDVCLLPKASGQCTGFADRWYFDMRTRACKAFKYGGFEEEGNVFPDRFSCQRVCRIYLLDEETEEKSCQPLPASTSQGYDRCMPKRRFRFNAQTNQCEDFSSFGCKANRDSFDTIDECEAVCVTDYARANEIADIDTSDPCSLPVQAGNCRSRLARFYYNSETGLCSPFWYTGCKGNANNFEDERSCIQSCVKDEMVPRAIEGNSLQVSDPCSMNKDNGPCRGRAPKWHFDQTDSTCRLFFYGGCQGNANKFDTLHECSQTCPVDWQAQRAIRQRCTQPLATGTCRGYIPKFYFNQETNQCEQFFYSGCRGNDNNFETNTDCMLTCQFSARDGAFITTANGARTLPALVGPKKTAQQPENTDNGIEGRSSFGSDDPCLLDKAIGHCRAAFPKFYFDKNTNECKQFTYGGCGGNNNNFPSLEVCQQTCQQHIPNDVRPRSALENEVLIDPVCAQPMDMGPCKALRPMWFNNATSGECQRFFWGGCRGNDNRFASEEECQSKCMTPEQRRATTKLDVNRLPMVQPKCKRGGQSYNLGDILRFESDKCLRCTCASPPDLLCQKLQCPDIDLPDPSANCQIQYDEDGCCAIGFACVSANPPMRRRADCSLRICPAIAFLPQEGKTCTPKYDDDGCCQVGLDCVDDEEEDKCRGRPCLAIGFLPQKGKKCTPKYDNDGCCQIGLDCVDDPCATRPCPAIGFLPQKGKKCTPKYDNDGCCQVGLDCVDDPCATRPCPAIGFLPPRGKICTKKMDDDGCCQIGLDCVEP